MKKILLLCLLSISFSQQFDYSKMSETEKILMYNSMKKSPVASGFLDALDASTIHVTLLQIYDFISNINNHADYNKKVVDLKDTYNYIKYDIDAKKGSLFVYVEQNINTHRKKRPPSPVSARYFDNPAHEWLNPILIIFNLIATSCVFVFNASASAYMYGRLREKI